MSQSESVAIAVDEFGEPLRSLVIELLGKHGYEYVDYSKPGVDYPDLALAVASAVAMGVHHRGILVCGTGLGMAVTANKVPGIRAVTANDVYSAERARRSLNAQILAMGAQVVEPGLAADIVHGWLASEYEGGRSAPKYARLLEIDKQFRSLRNASTSRQSE